MPGSLRIAGLAPPAGAPTDLPGDDLGQYDPVTRTVGFSLGDGATPSAGGTIAAAGQPGSDATVSFDAEVDPGVGAEHEITNAATAGYVAPTLGTALSAISNPAAVVVKPGPVAPAEADIAVAQTETDDAMTQGGEVQDAATVRDLGPDDATDVVVEIDPPPGAVIEAATADAGRCVVETSGVTCTIAHIDNGGSAQIDLVEAIPTGDELSGAVNEVTATAAQLDPRPADNSDAVSAPPAPPEPAADAAELQTTVSADRARVTLGDEVTDTVTVHDAGPGAATEVDLTGTLSTPAELVSVDAPAGACEPGLPLHCRFAQVPADGSVTVGLVLRPLRARRLLDTVSASGATVDPVPANAVAAAATIVRPAHTDVALRVGVARDRVRGGGTVRGVVTVTNQGSTAALGVTACTVFRLPLELVRAPGAVRRGDRECWSVPVLGARASVRRRFVVAVSPTAILGRRLAVGAGVSGADFAARRARAQVTVIGNGTGCVSAAVAGGATARIAW